MITFDTDDLHSLALCVWKEARGEGIDGMRAVMHVIKNRVGTPGFAHTIHDVVYGKNQFTSMSVPSDPEFNLEPHDDDQQYTYCVQTAPSVLNATDTDNTQGACYYANLRTATSGWFYTHIVQDTLHHPQTVQIGKQTFFK